MKPYRLLYGVLISSLFGGAAHSVPPRDIVVAQVAPMTGPISFYAQAISGGAQAYFSAVNARGGVRGARIQWVARDDGMDPAKTVALYRELARTSAPVAFLYPIAPAAVDAVLDAHLPQELGIPVLGTLPPMYKRRTPLNPQVFHVGQGDDREVRKIVEHIAALGIREAALVHWDAPAVQDAVQIVEAEAALHQLKLTVKLATPSTGKANLAPAVMQVVTAKSAAVITLLPVNETAALVQGLRDAGSKAWVYGPSYNEARLLFKIAGQDNAVGTSISQTVPNPYNTRLPLVAQYQNHLRDFAPAGTEISTLSLEGYIAARILVQAMERTPANSPITPDAVRNALEGLRNFDLGGLTVNYSPQNHVAINFMDIGMVTYGGKLRY